MDYTMYIQMTELRLQKDVSEYQMSFALGQNKKLYSIPFRPERRCPR